MCRYESAILLQRQAINSHLDSTDCQIVSSLMRKESQHSLLLPVAWSKWGFYLFLFPHLLTVFFSSAGSPSHSAAFNLFNQIKCNFASLLIVCFPVYISSASPPARSSFFLVLFDSVSHFFSLFHPAFSAATSLFDRSSRWNWIICSWNQYAKVLEATLATGNISSDPHSIRH